jgi:hypothetical protein
MVRNFVCGEIASKTIAGVSNTDLAVESSVLKNDKARPAEASAALGAAEREHKELA